MSVCRYTNMIDRHYWIRVWYRALRCFAIAMLLVYGVWQVCWLGTGQLPPAIFLAVTGLPAPTTGGVRSLICLFCGDWLGSLHYNAMTIPMTVMAIGCAAWVMFLASRRRQIHLPQGMGLAWVVLLAVAWSIKLLQMVFDN